MHPQPAGIASYQRKPQAILLIEDDEGLAILFQQALETTGLPFESVGSGGEGIEKIAANKLEYLLLLDYSLPDMKAAEAIAALSKQGRVPPFIVITGHGDERVAVEMMRLGASDYLIKDTFLLDRLPGVVERVLREVELRITLKTSESALQRNMGELAAIYDHIPIIMLLLDGSGRIRKANRAASRFFRKPAEGLIGVRWGEAFECEFSTHGACGVNAACEHCVINRCVAETQFNGNAHRQVEAWFKPASNQDGGQLFFLLSTDRIVLGDEMCLLLSLEDITERKRLEDDYRQSQKMEAVGQLAGGVAHDFNNILCVMMMHLHMIKKNAETPQAVRQQLADVENQAERAANLTRQLLLFSRRQAMQFKQIDLNTVLEHLLKMLRRILGEQIELVYEPGVGPMRILGDSGVMEQVIMNLCVNARDAMPKGGALKILTSIVRIDANANRANPEAREGQFACLTVADTGCGMDETTQKRIFEPFFTTKPAGQGTGLGLATVYGIAKEHKGWVEVESAPGKGSTFRVLLPLSDKVEFMDPKLDAEPIKGGGESILLVEDDRRVRMLVKLCLKSYGYEVVEASSGTEALTLWPDLRERLHLLFTDMVMPGGVSGLELANRLRAEKASLKVIIGSGYSDEMARHGIPNTPGIKFIAKPYSPDALLATVRECLDK